MRSQLGMLFHCATDLQRAFHRRFRRVVKHQRHPIAGRNRNQPMICFGFTELFGAANNLIQHLEQAPLLIDQELGVADDVDKEDIGDLKLDLLFYLR
jgi:hypothetical protein